MEEKEKFIRPILSDLGWFWGRMQGDAKAE